MKTFDCMFHDEGIPDAPCNCATGEAILGHHPIVTGQVAKMFDLPVELLRSSHDNGCDCFPERQA